MWTYWPILAGLLILLFTLHEVFRDLFHPSASGSLSEFIARRIFQISRYRLSLLPDAGPLSVVVVIFTWAVLICVGFALIYWGWMPGNFKSQSGRPREGFLPMVYFSLEVMTTLGLGDYAPESTPLRLLVTFESLVGFALLTASVSSIVLIYPALGRLRVLARQTSILVRMEQEMGLPVLLDGAGGTLEHLAFEVARTRVDFIHFPILYYFYSAEETASLPGMLPHLVRFANAGLADGNSEAMRRAAGLLLISLRDLAETLRGKFLDIDAADYRAVFRAYARAHVLAPPSEISV